MIFKCQFEAFLTLINTLKNSESNSAAGMYNPGSSQNLQPGQNANKGSNNMSSTATGSANSGGKGKESATGK